MGVEGRGAWVTAVTAGRVTGTHLLAQGSSGGSQAGQGEKEEPRRHVGVGVRKEEAGRRDGVTGLCDG